MDGSEVPLNYAAFALPIFLVAIVLEALFSKGARAYSFGTAMSDVGTGGVFQSLELLFKLGLFALYGLIYQNFALWHFEDGSWAPLLISIIGVDFLFYWWHRASHTISIFWAVHGVHHQSEDFNLAVALRQPAFEPITWFLFYVPLAFMGISLEMYLIGYGINRFYQFWLHTEAVGKLGPLEWIFVTPSAHRVHHGVQEQYLDKNYGAVLGIWDRMFGSYEPEVEPPIYGTTEPLGSYNPLWANFKLIEDIVERQNFATSAKEKLMAWFAPPGWRPTDFRESSNIHRLNTDYQKYRPEASSRIITYVTVHYVLIITGVIPFLLYEPRLSHLNVALGGLTFFLANIGFCALIEGQTWANKMEYVRHGLMVICIVSLLGPLLGAPLSIGAAALYFIGAIISLRSLVPQPKPQLS